MTIYDEYVTYTLKYQKEYGKNTIVLYQNGAFMELFSANDGFIDIKRISQLLDIQLTRKNKSILEVNTSNLAICGFPLYVLKKFTKILVENNYTVVVVSQTSPPPNPRRDVTDIISAGTMIENIDSNETNNLMTIYLEQNQEHNSRKIVTSIGLSVIDLSTGENSVFETSSSSYDPNFALDECFRLLTIYDPREIIVFGEKLSMTYEHIVKYLEIENKYVHNRIDNVDKYIQNINYQKQLLKRVFKNHGALSVIEYLDLERLPCALISYVALLQFAYSHNENIIEKITKPHVIIHDDKLILGYNTTSQLNVLALCKILNNCSTSIGKRAFKHRLLNPETNIDNLKKKYDTVDLLLDGDKFKDIQNLLDNVYDIERLFRKMHLKKLHPADFVQIDNSFESISKLLHAYSYLNICDNKLDKRFVDEFIQYYRTFLDFEEIEKYHLDNITQSFFKPGFFDDIDEIQRQLNDNVNIFTKICEELNRGNEKDFFEVKHNDRDQYHLCVTKTRYNNVKKKIDKLSYENINFKDFDTKPVSSSSSVLKITHKLFKDINEKIVECKFTLRDRVSEEYGIFVKNCCQKFERVFYDSIEFVIDIDIYSTNAKNARAYKYCKPAIADNKKSFFDAKCIRHPIIERISDKQYITNDISLGKEPDGILLYGLNSVGKCFQRGTQVMMFNGSIKEVQHINVGDQLMGDDSTPRNVLNLTRGQDVLYKIVTTKGEGFTVNKYHILVLKGRNYVRRSYEKKCKRWKVSYFDNGNRISKSFHDTSHENSCIESQKYVEFLRSILKNDIIEISVENYLTKATDFKSNYYLYTVSVKFEEREVPIDPYFIGLWLGDGTTSGCHITNIDQEIIEYVEKFCDKNKLLTTRVGITSKVRGIGWRNNTLLDEMRNLDVINNKHIPEIYSRNSYNTRYSLLAGLIDSDGYNCHNDGYEIIQKNEQLADDIIYLVKSLGFTCYKKLCKKSCKYKGEKREGTYFRMYIYGSSELYDKIPCLLNRKIVKKISKDKSGILSFKVLKQTSAEYYYGFQVDGNLRFLLNNFIVTHNSSIMKSIGLNILMAQSGMFVPCEKYTFKPYKYIFSRIPSGDDIFKAQSTFTLEITELRNILKRSDENSIVIGDELCAGTESISALSIVSAGIIQLSERKTSFIFATHLHDLVNIEKIKNISNLNIKHLSIHYDEKNSRFIYDRKLKDGQGSTLYGLEVCKGLDLDKEFLSLANSIRQDLLNIDKNIVNSKKSRYNSKLFVDTCEICGKKADEVHHIKQQCHADVNGFINHVHKNASYNLVNVCETCHDKIHRGDININGYCVSTDGTFVEISQ